MHWVNDSYFIQHLQDAAHATKQARVVIDPLESTVTPDGFLTPAIRKAMTSEPAGFRTMLTRQGCVADMVRSVELTVDCDLESPAPRMDEITRRPVFSDVLRKPEWARYSAEVRLVDARGREYTSRIPEWWRE
jgi:hypothetical protein